MKIYTKTDCDANGHFTCETCGSEFSWNFCVSNFCFFCRDYNLAIANGVAGIYDEIAHRLNNGEVLFIGYVSSSNKCGYALKLVQKSLGRFDRFWYDTINNEWNHFPKFDSDLVIHPAKFTTISEDAEICSESKAKAYARITPGVY